MATVATTGLAGCGSLRDDGTDDDTEDDGDAGDGGVGNSFATDVVAFSGATAPRTVSITITDTESDTPHTDRTLDLAPGETVDPVNSGKLPANGSSYTVDVVVEDGPSETFEWTDPSAELAPLWVRVDDSQNITFLLQAG